MSLTKVTLIGTFRRDPEGLKKIFQELSAAFDLLSPHSVDFLDFSVEFVKAKHEKDDSVRTIEDRVLHAIKQSDAIWLFAPGGYIGVSTAFEIGFALSINVPVYTNTLPSDPLLKTMVTKVDSVSDLINTTT